jgi:AcrR family transcriptional regulator
MARSIPPQRLPAVLAAAAGVFVTHGYQRSQMQDVADALGLAKGTLYRYAASKAALFAAVVRYADGVEPPPGVDELPVGDPAPGELAGLIAARLTAEVGDMALTRALTSPHPLDDVTAELAGIVVDLYQRLARHRTAIKLVDRCAPELPDLAAVWFGTARGAQMSGVEAYLRARQATGALALPGPAPLVARTLVELCVLWAVHCRFDPAPPSHTAPSAAAAGGEFDDDTVAATLAALLTQALTHRHPCLPGVPDAPS